MNEVGQSNGAQHRDDGWPAPHMPEQYGHVRDIYSVGQRSDWANGELDGPVAPNRSLYDSGGGEGSMSTVELWMWVMTVGSVLFVIGVAVGVYGL